MSKCELRSGLRLKVDGVDSKSSGSIISGTEPRQSGDLRQIKSSSANTLLGGDNTLPQSLFNCALRGNILAERNIYVSIWT